MAPILRKARAINSLPYDVIYLINHRLWDGSFILCCPPLHNQDKNNIAYQMVMANMPTVSEIAAALNMSRSTLYRYIEKRRTLV